MYPLKFKKNLVKKIWGGRKFKEILNMELPDDELYGESWEVSSHKGGLSYVENGEFQGKSLIELIEKYGKDILGEEITDKFKGKFPLLIKYLDINDRLSVQVHPSDEYALRVEGEFGKSESWYIMEASDDATLILGIKAAAIIRPIIYFSAFISNSLFNLSYIINVSKALFNIFLEKYQQ